MMNAYDKLYLEHARTAFGRMLDYAVNELKIDISEYYKMFLDSEISCRFSRGEPDVVVGKSGVEIVYDIMLQSGRDYTNVKPVFASNRSREYWTGWSLAYYQWETGMRFDEIEIFAPITEIREMYEPFHEMDIRQFADRLNEQYHFALPDSNLKRFRKKAGLSQKDLAILTEIPIRTIQQYEQRQKNINKAQVDYLVSLSDALGCKIECLLEKVERPKQL